MLEGLSNITAQANCPLTWPQKLNKLDDRKSLERGIGIESEKYANKLEIKKYEN